ncbi:MAG: hypothetical protein P8078_09365, partial [bacterium]
MIRYRIINIFLGFLLVIILSLLTCKSADDITAPKVEVGKGFLQVLPLKQEDFDFFANIGWTPGKIFPCDHGGFLLSDITKQVPVFSPADMTITRIMATVQGKWGYTDYALNLSVNQEEFIVTI